MQVQTQNGFSISQSPKTLPGTFWGVTTFFNPAHYKNKKENYLKFRESSKRQGLKLIAVELAFNNDEFELTKDQAEILVQVRSNSIMWQKERLLNIGLKHLPQDCDKVAWIDCDILFQNDNWIKEASKLLEKYNAVQLFSFFVRLPEGCLGQNLWQIPFGMGNVGAYTGQVYSTIQVKNSFVFPNFFWHSRPGGAWVARRSDLEKFRFYDKIPVGFGDSVMMKAFLGRNDNYDRCTKEMRIDQDKWTSQVYEVVKGNIFYLDGIVLHFWHGNNSGDYQRAYMLLEHNFNPCVDLKINQDGCFEWGSDKQELDEKVKQYILNRF